MSTNNKQLDALKTILDACLQPQHLDTHPWATSLIAQEEVGENLDSQENSPGQRLVLAIGKLFTQMMPSTPPRRGKRLDTRWGEFGLLAAQYFAPLQFGTPFPASLREAWGRIDKSILLFAYGKPEDLLSPEEKEIYKLVGDEKDVTPNSTLSDWNRKGLQHLFEMILARENYLSKSLSKPVGISRDGGPTQNSFPEESKKASNQHKKKTRSSRLWTFGFVFIGIAIIGLIIAGGFKARQVYKQAMLVRQDAIQIQDLITASNPALERIKAAGPSLSILKQDFGTLEEEIGPFLWLGPRLSWIPVYGGDLASVQDLMTMADDLLACADTSYQAVSPLLDGSDLSGLNPVHLTEFLKEAQPQLIAAQAQLGQVTTARNHLVMESLSPEIQKLILNDVDPLLDMLQNGLTFIVEFPRLMGATSDGPKTYLLLVLNKDELRPIGGLVTAVGTLLVQDGKISSMNFQDSGLLENWAMPYPAAPWQLQQYMNSRVLILGDTSWFTNYPTAALYAETLYSYADSHSVDGVIAFDQQMLVEILGATGPINLEGVPYPIDASNVIDYMRASKTPTVQDLTSPGWSNKAFMMKIASALVGKMFSGEIQPEKLAAVLLQALNEHHLLLKFDDSSLTNILSQYRWDGAVRPETGDFLMVADSNIGFDKTNAVVDSSLVYDVNLVSPFAPIGSLTVVHTNHASATICKAWDKLTPLGEDDYPIDDCYWNYLRVYLPAGTTLIDATPQFVPSSWMILQQNVPARVDTLSEPIDGVQAFGTLQVVPGGESNTMSFRFALPAWTVTIQPGTGWYVYHLLVQKQPGTLANLITISVTLPENASIQAAPASAVIQGNSILIQTNLRTDLDIEIAFQVP